MPRTSGCHEQGYFTAVWLSLGWVFPGYFPPGYSTPACACFAFCNRAALCHTPRGPARCSPAPGLWDVPGGTRVPCPQLIEPPSPRSGSPCVSSKSAAPAMARGRRDCRVIDPFRAVAAAAPTYSVACAGIPQSIQHPEIRAQYDFFDFRADRARSDSAGLHLGSLANPFSFSPDLSRAFCSVWVASTPPIPPSICASFLRLRFQSGCGQRDPVCVDGRRHLEIGEGPRRHPSVLRRLYVQTPWPALPPTTKPQHCCLPDVGTFGAANRIMFRNRVLGVIARIYQGTSRILPRFTI